MKYDKVSKFMIDKGLALLKPVEQVRVLFAALFRIRLIKVVLILLLCIILIPLIFFLWAKPVPQKNINYGITFSNKYAEELGMDWKKTYLKIIDDLKIKNLRLVAYWDDIEKDKDLYDFTDIEWQLDEADKRGIAVIMTVGRKVPRYPECFEPTWWKDIKYEEIRNDELYKYVEDAVNALKHHKSIYMWQVENEPYFPFGECLPIKASTVAKEIEIVRSIDKRPILTQDSGEGGFWYPSYKAADYLGISMYRKIWYDFWGIFFGRFIYFQYPLAHWTYKIKADIVQVPYQKIIVTELQAEPWGPGPNHLLKQEDKDQTMSRQDFIDTINYAQKAGFKDLYFWGAEWWLFEKEYNNEPFYWDTAKALIN